MYCVLAYAPGWTNANMLSDIVAVLTGETTVGDLSASLDDANSEIVTTYTAAGWSLYDDISATEKVIRAPVFDDAAQYVYLDIAKDTDQRINAKHWRLWNSGTHTGTDQATGTLFINTASATSASVKLYISASANHFFCICDNNGTFTTTNCGLFQYRRASPWDTAANAASQGYVNTVWDNSFIDDAPTPICPKTLRGYDLLAVANQQSIIILPSGTNSSGMNALIGNGYSDGKTFKSDLTTETYLLYPWGISYPTIRNLGGEVTSLCDVWYLTTGYGNNLDDFERSNGKDYKIWMITSSAISMAVPYG